MAMGGGRIVAFATVAVPSVPANQQESFKTV